MREQLEQLASEVLVRMALDVLAVVQIHQHPGILQDPDEQIAQVAGGVGAQHPVLLEHHPVVAHLVLPGREVTVPEERQLLFERPRRDEHAIRPPEPKPLRLDVVGRQAVEELVDDRLKSTLRAGRQHFFAETFAALASPANCLGPARRKRIHPGIPDAGLVERLQRARVDRFVVNEAATARSGVIAARRAIPSGVAPKPARSMRCAARW